MCTFTRPPRFAEAIEVNTIPSNHPSESRGSSRGHSLWHFVTVSFNITETTTDTTRGAPKNPVFQARQPLIRAADEIAWLYARSAWQWRPSFRRRRTMTGGQILMFSTSGVVVGAVGGLEVLQS